MDSVNFKVNGMKYSVGGEVSSTMTLLEYLRRCLELRGTKYMCQEGGCGSCMVSAKKTPNSNPESVNSCLVSIPSCDGWEITTIEKVGNRLDGYHPLQRTLAETYGTQCGYCSPGFVMSMYSLLNSNNKLTMLDIEQKLASNTCRCTGYRPILEAFKKFASDAPRTNNDTHDIEDINLCSKTNKLCSKNSCEESDWCFITHDSLEQKVIHIHLKDNKQWFKVYYVNDIFQILQKEGSDSYMLVAGNTGKGVRHIIEYPRILIDISGVSELKGFVIDQNLVVGAGVTLSEFIDILKNVTDTEYFDYLKVVNEHLQLVAHVAVRNLGTIAGNLILKYLYRDFTSDLFLIFQTIGAQMTLATSIGETKTITMEQFLDENMKGKIILNILLPPLSSTTKLVTFKVSARSRNAHAIVNAGFLYKLNVQDNTVISCSIVYGGLSLNFSKARRTEIYLVGKPLFNNDVLQSALKILNDELVVTEIPPEPSVKYRKQVALGLFYKSLLTLCPDNILSPKYKSGSIKLHLSRPVSTASQTFTSDPAVWPLNQTIPKVEALFQCAGEAKYTDDQPQLPREVFATFVLTTIAKGNIKSIDPSEALRIPGVVAFYTAKDIPGVNSFTPPEDPSGGTNEVILCDGKVEYFSQPLGIIVAESSDIANKAALFVKVVYVTVQIPEIDIRKNKKNPSKVTLYSSIKATDVGKDVVKLITGEQTTFGQYHYCLETLSCVAWPSEDGLKVKHSSHFLTAAHIMTARCLNIDQSRIDMKTDRIGGSFGCKLSRQSMVTTACSLVAYKMNRPCRFVIPLQKQTRATGKRMPSSTNYEVAVDSNGVIQYVNYDLYNDDGYIINEDYLVTALNSYFNCYNRERWNFKCSDAVTDTASNTFCRAPGTMETINTTEMIMERISYELGLDPLQVRLNNIDMQYKDIIELIATLKVNSNYAERRKNVDKFNSDNRWKKRGLRFAIMKWQSTFEYLLNITVSVYVGDGSVAIVHGGVEMGQGINTKAIQVCAYFLNIPVSKIKAKSSNTMNRPNNSHDAASFTTQNALLGVERACKIILKRLDPVKQQMNNPTWEQLVAKAFELGVNLQANSLATFDDVYETTVYAATLAEVEIDVLTGESEILKVDLIEDVGRSINPYLDIGQIEGAFVQGIGFWTSEELVYNPRTGELLTDRSWNYFVPICTDIPQDFTVHFRDKSYSRDVILGTKATGEPPICMGVVIPLAMREAMVSARLESGLPSNKWFQIDGPYTVEKIGLACETKLEDFKFY